MNIKTPAVLLLCLSMGCSTTRSAAGGFSLATGIATGFGAAIALTGVAASNDYSGDSVLPMVAGISMSALLSTTFLTLADYLLGNEGICASASTALWRRAADQTVGITRARAEVEEAARIARTETARSSAIRLCRQIPNGVVTPRFSTTTVRCINGAPQPQH